MSHKRTRFDSLGADINWWSESPAVKLTKREDLEEIPSSGKGVDGIDEKIPDGSYSPTPRPNGRQGGFGNDWNNRDDEALARSYDRGINGDDDSLVPRALMVGQNPIFQSSSSHLLGVATREPKTHRPSFAVASTLFQRDHSERMSSWPRRDRRQDRSFDDAVGRLERGLDPETPREEGGVFKGDFSMEEEEAAWLDHDDGIFADFGNSDFTPLTRIQL